MNVKKIMLVFGFALVLASIALGADGPLTDGEIRELVRRGPSEKERPGEDGLVLFEGIFPSFANGKAEVRRQRLIKVYSEWAVEHLGDPRVSWDRSRQELIIHGSRTYFPDGTHIDSPENAFNDVTPDGLDLAAEHIDIREMVVTHVGLEREVAVFLDYTVRDKGPRPVPFHALYFLHGEFPALRKVIVAEGLYGETMNVPSSLWTIPRPEMRGERLVWEAENLPAAPEEMLGHEGDMLSWIAVSETEEWNGAVRGLAADIALSSSKRETLAPLLREAWMKEPPVGIRDALKKMGALVKDRIAEVRYEPWRYMAKPRTVDKVIARSYATPVERCALLLACCEEMGYRAQVIVPSRWRFVTPFVPAFELLGDPVLIVQGDRGEKWWWNPSCGCVGAEPPFGEGHELFIIDGDRTARDKILFEPSEADLSVYWDLAKGEGNVSGTFTGGAAVKMNGGEPEKAVREWARGWCDGAEAVKVRILEATPKGFRFEASVKAPLPEKDDRGFVTVDLPALPFDASKLLPEGPGLERSAYDGVLFGEGPVNAHVSWKVRLPEDHELVRSAAAEVRGGRGIYSVKSVRTEDLLDVDYRLIHEGMEVPPAEYAAYRGLLLALADGRNTRLLLRPPAEDS